MKLARLVKRILYGWTPFGNRHCVYCGHSIWRFLPYLEGSKNLPPLPRALGCVGSDADNFGCPRCGAHDRERHLLLYLKASGQLSAMRDKAVLHFAPEKQLPRWIAAAGPSRYVRCDLQPKTPDVQRVDMLSMEFETASFDVVIANHVLEHVADDRQALSEVCRVLKIGGYAILQTPYCKNLHRTWEDPGTVDDAMRLQAYGQEDHVRLYGRDIFERFIAAGLESCVRQHDDLLGDVDPISLGINSEEPFFLFRHSQS